MLGAAAGGGRLWGQAAYASKPLLLTPDLRAQMQAATLQLRAERAAIRSQPLTGVEVARLITSPPRS